MTDIFDAAKNTSTVINLTDWLQMRVEGEQSEPDAEAELFLEEQGVARRDHPGGSFIHQLFAEQVERTPNAIAVVYEQQSLSYRDLNSRANQLAHYLQALSIGPGTLVGICLERSLDMIISILAVLKAGGGYVPLDPTYPQERLAFMLRDAQIQILITRHMEHLLSYQTPVMLLDPCQEIISQERTTNPVSVVSSRDIAYMIYTSGSTGLPKGVAIEHYGLCNMLQEQIRIFGVQAYDRIAHFASFSFDASVSEMFLAFLAGAQLYLVPQERRWPAPVLLEYLQEYTITMITLPPSALALLPPEKLPMLRTIISAGEELSAEIAARWFPERLLFNAYGPTEGTVCVTIGRYRASARRPSIGQPIANIQIYLLDTLLRPVARGAVGEMYIGGMGLARGYFKRPELTAERFLPHPFSQEPGARLYKTGDLARFLPDGSLECLGRIDRMVKIRGFRVELGEIEAVLEQHPLILQSLVTVFTDPRGTKRLAAYVITPPAYTQGEQSARLQQEVLHFLQGKLPGYMRPAVFLILNSFPLSPVGKIDLRALPAPDFPAQKARYSEEKQ